MSRPFSSEPDINVFDALRQISLHSRELVISLDTFYHFIAALGGPNSAGGSALIQIALASGYTPDLARMNEESHNLEIA